MTGVCSGNARFLQLVHLRSFTDLKIVPLSEVFVLVVSPAKFSPGVSVRLVAEFVCQSLSCCCW